MKVKMLSMLVNGVWETKAVIPAELGNTWMKKYWNDFQESHPDNDIKIETRYVII